MSQDVKIVRVLNGYWLKSIHTTKKIYHNGIESTIRGATFISYIIEPPRGESFELKDPNDFEREVMKHMLNVK